MLQSFKNFFIADNCICSGKANKYDEGSKCANYEDYEDEWYNGEWCYAATDTCSDARDHAEDSWKLSAYLYLSGYGASRAACNKGKCTLHKCNWWG